MFENYNNKLVALDEFTLNFNATGLMIMNITIAFIMFGVALGIKRENFLPKILLGAQSTSIVYFAWKSVKNWTYRILVFFI